MELFLENFLEYSIQPGAHVSDLGEVEPEYPNFTGFVFKVRAWLEFINGKRRLCVSSFVGSFRYLRLYPYCPAFLNEVFERLWSAIAAPSKHGCQTS